MSNNARPNDLGLLEKALQSTDLKEKERLAFTNMQRRLIASPSLVLTTAQREWVDAVIEAGEPVCPLQEAMGAFIRLSVRTST